MTVRNQVIGLLHHVTGPAVGLPALRALFPRVPRAVLADILSRYRRVWRRRYRRWGFQLTWHRAGAVWAMDHSEAPFPIDGRYRYLFAVRDLASHYQLAWQPVMTQRADEVIPILQQLFARHGAPLVLKSDNGSAFVAELTQRAMADHALSQLFSPAGRPQYNGALERSNSMLKTYTDQQAVTAGHPFRWTMADVDRARSLANTISRPWGHRGHSPEEAWQARAPLTESERDQFHAALELERAQATDDLGLDDHALAGHTDRSQRDRLAISRALERLGYMTKRRVVRRTRRAMQRAKREGRLNTTPSTNDAPLVPSSASTACRHETCATGAVVPRGRSRDAAKKVHALLALPVADGILRTSQASVARRHSEHAAALPPPSAQRGPTATSWWRRSFTLLYLRLKAAIFLG